jgi:signal transduction histidine kinase
MFAQMLRMETTKTLRRPFVWIGLGVLAVAIAAFFALFFAFRGNIPPAGTALLYWPNSLIFALGYASGYASWTSYGTYLLIVVVGVGMAQEYSWRTLQLWLSHGVTRPVLLGAKFALAVVPALLIVLLCLVVIGGLSAIFSLTVHGTVNVGGVHTGELLLSALVFLVFGAIAGAIFGLVTARGFTRRFARVATVVDRWSQGDFSLLALDRSDDELGQLARQLNRMAEQLQHLLQTRQKLATLEERNRLARELHDSVKQQVFAVSLQVSTAKGLMAHDADEARAHLGEAERLVRQAQLELTSLIRELRPAALEHQGLLPALREFAAQWSRQSGIAVDIQTEGEAEHEDDPPLLVEETLFRIAQEALANVGRHSQATNVTVRVVRERAGATLTVADNGQGFDPATTTGQGVGLLSMRERAQALGGEVVVASAPGQGTTVTAHCAAAEVGV